MLAEPAVSGEPPQIDVAAAMAYRRETEKVLVEGSPAEQKQILRTWVAETKLAPEALEVTWTYRIPEAVLNSSVAGAYFAAMQNALAAVLVRKRGLPANGRRAAAR